MLRLIYSTPIHSPITSTHRASLKIVKKFLNNASWHVAKPISILLSQRIYATTVIDSPISGLEDDLVGYVLGKKKATEVAHKIWKHVVKIGDTVIDATCGNGHDTLEMLRLVADKSGRGCVYGMDIQRAALENTSSLLRENFTSDEKELVKLICMCHSRMEEIIPKDCPVRLVAFNLGYLPRGDKAITTALETTLLALEAATRILIPGGLISLVVYVGHPGGRYGNFEPQSANRCATEC